MIAKVSADVVVVGGGLSGTVAALAAREAGRSVAVVRRSLGMTALSSGLLPVAPGWQPRLAERVRDLAAARPDHPYALLAGALADALAFAGRELPGLRFTAGETGLFLGPAGGLVPAEGALSSLFAGDLARASGTVAIVGLLASPSMDGAVLARLAADSAHRAGLRVRILGASLAFGDPGERAHMLANRIDEDPAAFATRVAAALPGGAALALLPPVLGAAALAEVEHRLGVACAMWAAAPPSLPGMHLQRLLDARLATAGIPVIAGEVFAEGDAIRVRDPAPTVPPPSLFDAGRADELPAPGESAAVEGRVVLATGRFVGGGLRRAGRLRETVLDLPVWLEGQIDEGRSLLDFTSYELAAEQPAFRAGLRVDARMRPLHRDGSAAPVFACGDLLGGTDPARDGTWAGVAIASGYVAGREAATRA